MKATHIKWDTDGEEIDLPDEIEIPDGWKMMRFLITLFLITFQIRQAFAIMGMFWKNRMPFIK